MKADSNFPICVSGCGRRGNEHVWYQISENARFGECLRCHSDRIARRDRIEGDASGWEWPDEPTGPGD